MLSPRSPKPADGWKSAATIVAIVSALISLGGAGLSWYSASIGNDIQRQAAIDQRQAAEVQKNAAQTQALTTLSQQSETLQKGIETNGVGDMRDLTNFFYLLGEMREKQMITKEFYDQQIQTWCPVTTNAQSKLAPHWTDAGFRKVYEGSPWFLMMLDKLTVKPGKDQSACL